MCWNKRKKKIGIFGGSFDPPTSAHIDIVHYLIKKKIVDEIWIMPCDNHTLKDKLSDWKHRLCMCEYTFKSIPNVYVSAFDCTIKTDGSTFDLMNILRRTMGHREYQKYNFCLIIGQDNAEEFYKWKEYKRLVTEQKFIIIPRGKKNSYCENEYKKFYWYNKKPHKLIKNFTPINISSTIMREKIINVRTQIDGWEGEQTIIQNDLKTNVYEYILEHELYKE